MDIRNCDPFWAAKKMGLNGGHARAAAEFTVEVACEHAGAEIGGAAGGALAGPGGAILGGIAGAAAHTAFNRMNR